MLPTGTVTFLRTDIEGSSQRWERDLAAMQAVLARHNAILDRARRATMVGVIGPSVSGKSGVVFAGLVLTCLRHPAGIACCDYND